MKRNKHIHRGLVLAVAITTALAAAAPAAAAVPAAPAALEVDLQEILADVEPTVLDDVADVPPTTSRADALTVQTANGDVTVPRDPQDPIELTAPDGDTLAVTLPFADEADDAVAVTDGIVAYDNGNGSHTAPVVKDDGSVQITTIIEDADAPESYPYEVNLPADATVEEVEGGGMLFRSADGKFLGGLTPPWAKDANGVDVPTRYEVAGTAITQVVDHRAQDVAYPVVADPWIGVDLFSYTGYNRKGTYGGQVAVSAKMSAWGWSWYLTPEGPAILLTAGWSELVSKRPQADDKASLLHQYQCHVAFGAAVWLSGLHWDLEKARPNKSNWLLTAASHRCNW